MIKLAILFGVFFILSSTTAHFFPPNNEITYRYVSLIQLSTEKPTLFTSELLVNAQLTVKTFEKHVEAVLSDVDYSMYNGEGSRVGTGTNTLEIPPEAKSITQPFTIEYEKNGKVSGIKTQDGDNLWSVNIKKAIASTLQLDVDKMLPKIERTYGFYSDESTVHGMCNTLYSVLPDDDDNHFWVKKYTKPMMCKGFKWDTDFKIYAAPCSERLENPISLSSERLYEVTRKDDGFLINRVETMNTILMAPFRGNSDMYSVMANQTLIFVKAEGLKDATPETFGENSQHLKVHCQHGDSETESNYDMTGGRASYDETVLINNAKKQLKQVINEMDHTQSHFSKSMKYPDIELNMLLFKLRLLNTEQLKKLYDMIDEENMANLFELLEKDTAPLLIQALPHVGTDASNTLIVNLISEKDVSDETAVKLLQRLPFYARHLNSKLVKALMSLCDKENVSEYVKNTAKIAAANVIHFITMKDSNDDVADFYTDKFIDGFTKSEKYSDRLTYYSTLANIKTRKTIKFLEHIVKNDNAELKYNRHLRTLTIWALKDEYIKAMDYYDKIYWPIFEDEDEDTETRVAVMFSLMYNPSINSLMKMHRLMEDEKDQELYNTYYTVLKTLSTSKLPCHKRAALNAKKILAITKKPRPTSTISFNFITDYFDSIFGLGEMMRVSVVEDFKDNKYLSFYYQHSKIVDNLNFNEEAVYVHLADEDEYLSNKLMYMDRLPIYFTSIREAISGSSYDTNTTVELISTYNGQIISANITGLFDITKNEQGLEKNRYHYDFDQSKSGVSFLATDLGMCANAYLRTPSVSRMKYSHDILTSNFLTFRLRAMKTSNPILGLGFYNPFADILHGIQRIYVGKFYFPLDVFASKLDEQFKITFNHTANEVIEDFGFQTSVSSQVFTLNAMDDNSKLKLTCPDCDQFAVITKGKDYQNEETIFKKNLEILGFSFKFEIFDCERKISEKQMEKFYQSITNRDTKNIGDIEPLYFLLTMSQLMQFMKLSPLPGMCALRATIAPDHAHTTFSMGELYEKDPVTEDPYDFSYGFKYEMFQKDGTFDYWSCKVPQNMTKYDATASCTYKRGDKILRACFKRKMYYGKEHLHKSDNIISIGRVDDEKKCPEDETIVIRVSREQTEKLPNLFETILKTCTDEYSVLACVARHVISQKITVDINYEKVSPYVDDETILSMMVEELKDNFNDDLKEVEEGYTKEGNIKMNFLSKWRNTDMEFISPTEKFRLENVTDDVSESFMVMDSASLIYNVESIDFCHLDEGYYYNAGGERGFHGFTNKWSQIAAYDCNCPDKWELFVKREYFENLESNDSMEPWDFRIHSSGDNLELRSTGPKLQVYLNDELLEEPEDKGYYDGVWFQAKLFKHHRVFVLSFKNFDRIITIEHLVEKAKIILPNDYLTNECHAKRA